MLSSIANGLSAGMAFHPPAARSGASSFADILADAGNTTPATAASRAGTAPADPIAAADARSSGDAAIGLARLKDAIAAFRKEASLTPAQRARRDVLKTMNLTEDAIAAMPPEQRQATERKIAAEVARRMGLGQHGKDHAATTGPDGAEADPSAPTA